MHGVPAGGGGLYTLEGLDRRQVYKAKLLQEQYQQEIQVALAARLAYVDRQPDRIAITLKGGGRVTDHGDRLLTKSGRDQEILAAVALAKAKGWKTLNLTGADDFKRRAWLEVARAGLYVAGYQPSPELRAQLEKEKTMAHQAGAGGMMALTPDLTATDPNAAAKRRWVDALQAALEKLDAERGAANFSLLHAIDQRRKEVQCWLQKAQHRVDDDLLWQVGHHEAEAGKTKPAAMIALYQLRENEIARRKQNTEEERKAQIQREIAAQQQADAIQDQLGQPGLTAEQEEALEQQHRYYVALADGHGDEEAKERATKKSDAPRFH